MKIAYRLAQINKQIRKIHHKGLPSAVIIFDPVTQSCADFETEVAAIQTHGGSDGVIIFKPRKLPKIDEGMSVSELH